MIFFGRPIIDELIVPPTLVVSIATIVLGVVLVILLWAFLKGVFPNGRWHRANQMIHRLLKWRNEWLIPWPLVYQCRCGGRYRRPPCDCEREAAYTKDEKPLTEEAVA